MTDRQNYIQWIVDNATGIVDGQQLPFGQMVTPWASSISKLTNNLLVDPRNYGAKCTGWYGINPSGATIFRAGTGFVVGDTFVAGDLQLEAHMRGGANATGHVTSINASGGVTGFVIDTPGSGYFISALYVTPTSGQGQGFAINPTSIYSGPSAPSTSLASGGGSTAGNNSSYLPGGTYAVGDTFAIPNPSKNGNYMTGRVSAVTANGVVTAYTINNPGGDYLPVQAVPTITLSGFGTGLTINVLNATQSNNTWDDTYGIIAAALVANAAGGAVLIPNNTWVANLMPPAGTMLLGMGWGVNYAYGDVPNNVYPSTNPHMFIIGTPNFGIDFNAQGDIALVGFEVRGYTGTNFGSNTTWDSTCAIGSFVGGGGGGGSKVWLYQMSTKSCVTGLGSKDGTGAYIFCVSQNSDYGACYNGIYGPMSDFLSFGDTFASNANNAIRFPAAAGGLIRLMYPRIEYAGVGVWLDSGGLQCDLVGAQFDRIVYIGLYAKSVSLINMTGGNMKGCGLAGTLTITGAANNGSGLIRLTVTGFGNNANGGSAPTGGLATGQTANVSGVLGTTEANANQWTITVVDGTHIDLQGSTFTNAYVSGGFMAAGNNASYIVLDTVTDFHVCNVGFYGYSAGVNLSASNIIDAKNSTNISFYGGTANLGNGNQGSYQQAFANWNNAGNTPPVGFSVDMTGFNSAAIQTVVNGSVSGTATFSEPIQGYSHKEVVIYLTALNGTAAYTFPLPFVKTPAILSTNGLATTLVTTLTTTGCIVTGSTSTGFLFLKGY